MTSAIKLASSELIQGHIFAKLQSFFTAIAQAEAINSADVQYLLSSVSLRSSAAGCLAIVITQSKQHQSMIETLWQMTASADPKHQVIGILSVGHVGKLKDLSGDSRVL